MTHTTPTGRARAARPLLPVYAPRCIFDPARAWYDKLEINFDLGVAAVLTRAEAHRAFQTIAHASPIFRNDGSESYPKLIIKKKGNWLFGGEIRIQGQRGEGYYSVKAYLTLNPTSYFANNPPDRLRERSARGGGRLGYDRHYRLKPYGPVVEAAKYATPNGNFNYIPDDRIAEAFQTNWDTLLREHITEIIDLICNELATRTPPDTFRFNPDPRDWTVKSAEVYWEFHADHAAALVKDLGKYLETYFQSHARHLYSAKIRRQSATTTYTFQYKKNKDIQIGMYAKTKTRIRFECRFKKNIKKTRTAISDTRYPRTNPDAMYWMLRALKEEAVPKMEIMRHSQYRYDRREATTALNTALLITGVALSARNNPLHIKQLISDLMITGRTVETQDEDYNDTLHELRERDFLSHFRKAKNRPREYAPAGMLKTLLGKLS